MARGIISTILGGVAGGLEGRRDQFLREREEAERKAERDRLMETQNFGARMQLIQAGATPSARPSEDFGAQAAKRQVGIESTVGRALQDPAVAPPPDPRSLSERGVESALGRAFQAAEIAPRREQFIPQVQDPRYAQIQGLGGENDQWSIMTPQAMREDEQAMRAAEIADDRKHDFGLLTARQKHESRLAAAERELRMGLRGLDYKDQVSLLDLRRQNERDDMKDPELRRLRGQEMMMQVITRGGEFATDPGYLGQVAEAIGLIVGVPGPEMLIYALEELEYVEPEPEAPRLAPGIQRLQDRETARVADETQRQERIAELTDFVRQYEESLRRTPNVGLLRELNKTRGELNRLTGVRSQLGNSFPFESMGGG